jgi:hypothetical protein
MTARIMKLTFVVSCAVGLAVLLSARDGHAVPSFARQTGLSCTVCHTVWPQLTAFGRTFKAEGFTFSNESPSGRWYPPVAGMLQLSFTSLNSNQGVLTNGVAPFNHDEDLATDQWNLPQQASFFYGGKIIGHLGALAQVTYDGTANDVALDNTDIRYARTFKAGGKNLTVGGTINNSPTVEDLWNSTPVWGFPFAASAVAPTPTAVTLIDGTLGQQVGGIGAYASWADWIYGAFTVYGTTNVGLPKPLGAGSTPPDTITDGAVPYWRLSLFHQFGKHSFEIGTYGLSADVYAPGTDSGSTNSFTDYAFDGQYQFISNPHQFTLRTTWIHENQDYRASYPQGGTSNSSDTLKTFKINAGYFYTTRYGIFGGYAGYFSTTGTNDALLYAPDPVDGSATGSPNSNGFILEANWLFKDKYKLSIQYTMYQKFNGSETNYDGSGRNASDNNTLYLLIWLMF